jgi:hypothetical protein
MTTSENPTGPASAGENNPTSKKRRERSGLNKAEVRELNLAEQYVAVASRPERLAVLTNSEITAEFLAAMTDGIKAAHGHGASATQNDTGKESATIDEQEAKENLVTTMRCVQAAAKRKYARTQPEKLDDYAVGKKIDASRPVLEEFSAQMLETLSTERPPSINTTFITKLAATRLEFMAAGNSQASKKSAASAAREARKELVQTIKDRRLEIQFAADGAWPPGQPGNAAIRREFGLPPDRFLSVRRRKAA